MEKGPDCRQSNEGSGLGKGSESRNGRLARNITQRHFQDDVMTGISQLGVATADVSRVVPIFSPKGEGLDHCQKQKEPQEPLRRFL
jgi:hypothetical protein